jgi:capsular polysaccharide transport system permease protein
MLDRLKSSGLDPQKLLDATLATNTRRSAKTMRRRALIASFVAMVLLPAIAISVYIFLIASDQYHSTTAFAVRNSQATPATEVLGMVLNAGGESTTSNSYILHDYLQSQAIVEDVSKTIDLEEIFNNNGADWYFRMGKDQSIEDKVDYWNDMVGVNFDATSGVIFVEVRAFSAEDALKLSSLVLKQSEVLVNQISESSRRQSVRFAEESVARAEARLKVIRKQLVSYREETQEVSPEENARIAAEMIGQLDQTVAAKETEKNTLMAYLDAESPKIRMLTREIESLRQQIETERKRVGGGSFLSPKTGEKVEGGRSISFRIADYSELALEKEFAEQLYTTSLAGLEQARHEANAKHIYLATFIPPTLSEDAQYPDRYIYALCAFLLIFGIWIVCVLGYYNIRDRT